MITAIDTNILIDIFVADPQHGKASSDMLFRCMQEGAVCICEVVAVETATIFPKYAAFLEAIRVLEITFSTFQESSIEIATKAFKKYRSNGGKRTRVVADFLIAAHAYSQCDQILTRDQGFYRDYFQSLKVLNPQLEQ